MSRGKLAVERIQDVLDFPSFSIMPEIEAIYNAVDDELHWLDQRGLNARKISMGDFNTATVAIKDTSDPPQGTMPTVYKESYLVAESVVTHKAQAHRIGPNVQDYESIAVELILQTVPG